MRAIEFLKQMPWRKPWEWCGTWGWVIVSPSNTAKVSLYSTSSSSDGRDYSGFTVEITNHVHGTLVKSEFRFQDFLTTKSGHVPVVLERHSGDMEWKWGGLPLSCHSIVDAIEGYVYVFDGLNGDE